MTDLNLRQMVRDVLDETDLTEPTDVAEKVFAGLAPSDYGVALRQTLRQFSRVVMTECRPSGGPSLPQPSSSKSWKVQGIREAWARQLNDRYTTESGWKMLRDCTRDDLLFIAADRRRIAAENLAIADRIGLLADLMSKHGAPDSTAGEGTDTAPTKPSPLPRRATSARPDSLNGQSTAANQSSSAVEGTDSPATRPHPLSNVCASPGPKPADRQPMLEAHSTSAVGSDIPARQLPGAHHFRAAGGEQDSATTIHHARSKAAPSLPSESARPTTAEPVTTLPASVLADPTLALLADVLDDLEKTRIANENRLRALTRSTEDSDGEIRGFGLDETHPDVARLAGIVAGIARLEHEATLNLQRAMRKHALGAWVKATRGIGEKQGARLIAAIGDPYWNHLHDRPRTVSELWAYCGYKPGQKRRKGIRSNWSAVAKSRAYLIAEAMLKAGNRDIYDARKAATEGRLHDGECVRCGPSGNPAQPGSPWSDGHRHADALRVVAKKAVLMGLWREAKRIHEQASGQSSTDFHSLRAAGSDINEAT